MHGDHDYFSSLLMSVACVVCTRHASADATCITCTIENRAPTRSGCNTNSLRAHAMRPCAVRCMHIFCRVRVSSGVPSARVTRNIYVINILNKVIN